MYSMEVEVIMRRICRYSGVGWIRCFLLPMLKFIDLLTGGKLERIFEEAWVVEVVVEKGKWMWRFEYVEG